MAQIYYMGVPYGGRTTGGGSGDATWGNIGGVLANQTDLKTALDGKSAVTANPTLVGTEDNLTSVEIDGTKYGISGGGSSVIVNPIVTASTDELDSIGIDSANYDLYNSDDNRFYKPMYHDIHVIPDKHNTGCNESSLSEYDSSVTDYDGVTLEYRSDMNQIVANFNGANKSLSGTHTIEDIDFSTYPFNLYMAESYTGDGAKVIFNNCKFGSMTNAQRKDGLTFEFNDCTFSWAGGNNATFNRCFIGHTNGDACNVNTNCVLNDCYIADVVQLAQEQGSAHIDGVQVYQGGNCVFNNCRIEAPDINYSVKIGGFSYALFFENSPNCVAKHCVINGGGYYTIGISGTDTCKITDAIIGANGGSPFYPNYAESSTVNPNIADSLYVTSVWKESDVLHFLVTNDTMVDRVLDVVTPNGVTSFNVSRNYRPSDYEADTKDFDDLPIDVEYTINENAAYAVFYENGRQIRFANFTSKRISKKDFNTLVKQDKLVSGTNVKTINGESILGSSDISTHQYEVVDLEGSTSATASKALTANKVCAFTNGKCASLTITFPATYTIADEFNFTFVTSGSGCTLTVPNTVEWDGGDAPTLENSTMYEVSINGLGIGLISQGVSVT